MTTLAWIITGAYLTASIYQHKKRQQKKNDKKNQNNNH